MTGKIPDSSGAKSLREIHGLVQILGEDGSCQAVDGLVGAFDDLFHRAKLQNLLHWSEDLLKTTGATIKGVLKSKNSI